MLTCKQVSKALAESDYKELPLYKRLLLRFHITICFICKGYNKNVMRFHDMARAFRRYEDEKTAEAAPENAKKKWIQSIEVNASTKD